MLTAGSAGHIVGNPPHIVGDRIQYEESSARPRPMRNETRSGSVTAVQSKAGSLPGRGESAE